MPHGFYETMPGLCNFASQVLSSRNQLSIYRRLIEDKIKPHIELLAVDGTGLVHCSTFGPIGQPGFEKLSSDQTWKFFGNPSSEVAPRLYNYFWDHLEKFQNEVTRWKSSHYSYDWIDNNLPPVDLVIMKKYLPLPKWEVGHVNLKYYFLTRSIDDLREFGPIIYQSEARSFALPIVELCHLTVDLTGGEIEIKAQPIEEGILIHIIKVWRVRKYDCVNFYRGIIDYETFTFTDIQLVQETKEHNW
tara:strand:- start:4002 stop:4739 length:738 start_codon:yes stop_codon:yes gene_type:complete